MSQKSSLVSLPEPGNLRSNEKPPARHSLIKRTITTLLTISGAVVINIAYEKWAAITPLWLFIVLVIIVIFLSYCWIWDHEKIKELRPLIHKYSIMSFIVMSGIGIFVGGCLGALLWWSIYRQPTQNETQTRIEPTVETESKPLIPIAASPTPIPQSSATPKPDTKIVRPRKPRSKSLPDDAEDILFGRKKGPKIN